MAEWVLIGTAGCHLCELARDELQTAGLAFEEAELLAHPEWEAQFATRIPVLWRVADGAWLGWPFSAAEVKAALEKKPA